MELAGRASEPAGRDSEPAGRALDPVEGSPSKLGEPMRKLQCWEGLGPSWVSLGASWEGPRASGEGLRASWEGPEASWQGPKARWEAPGGGWTDGRKTKTKTEKITLCGDAIGHLPLRDRCPTSLNGFTDRALNYLILTKKYFICNVLLLRKQQVED